MQQPLPPAREPYLLDLGHRGFIEGVAAVLNVTAMELLDELQRGCVGS